MTMMVIISPLLYPLFSAPSSTLDLFIQFLLMVITTRVQQKSRADLITVWRIGMGLEGMAPLTSRLWLVWRLRSLSIFSEYYFQCLLKLLSLGNNIYIYLL